MSMKSALYWLVLALGVLVLPSQHIAFSGYSDHCADFQECNGLPCKDKCSCICCTYTCAEKLMQYQSEKNGTWYCSMKNTTFECKFNNVERPDCTCRQPLSGNLEKQTVLVGKWCDSLNNTPSQCLTSDDIFIPPPEFTQDKVLTVEERNDSLTIRWWHWGHVGEISADLTGVSLLAQAGCTPKPIQQSCVVEAFWREDKVTCTWTALTALVNYTTVAVRWLPAYQTTYDFTLPRTYIWNPDIVKNAKYCNITSVSIHLLVWETEQKEWSRCTAGFYLIKDSNNKQFGCAINGTDSRSVLCNESEKPEKCRQNLPLWSEIRATPFTVIIDNLWPSTEYNFTLIPVFCNKSQPVYDGKEYLVGPFKTLQAVIEPVTFPSTRHDNLTVNWITDKPHPNVNYTVYFKDALDGIINNTCTETVAGESILCWIYRGDTETTVHSCTDKVSWPFWEYVITVNASSIRANFNSSLYVVHTEPSRPFEVVSPNVMTAINASKCGDQRFTNYSFVCVTWYDRCPRERNGFIQHYLVNVTANNSWSNNEKFNSSFFGKTNMTDYRQSPERNYFHLVRVQPGIFNRITISALTNDSVEGKSSHLSVHVMVPKPALALNQSQGEELVMRDDVNKTMTSLQFTLPNTTFMFSDSNGFTLKPPIFIVTRSNEVLPVNVTGMETFDNYTSWHQRHNTSSLGYRIHLDVMESNTSIQLEIGSNQSCANSSDTGSYCNGPLEPGQTYSVSSALCNEMLCVFVTLVKDVSTLPQDKAVEVFWIMLLVGIGGAVAALLLILLVYLCCWQRRKKKQLEVSEWTQMKNVKGPRATRPMKLATLETVIVTKQRDEALMLRDEYCDLTQCTKDKAPHVACDSELNRSKNRWADIVAYDHSRVKLSVDEEGSDYINANFIPGYSREKEYIATQGPLPFTTNDFWKMVWEYQVPVIVMLTLPKEEGKIKCEHYWPAQINEMVEYGDIRVTTVSVSNVNDYNITIFTLQHVKEKGKELRVSHFQYLKWPDMTADVTAESMVEFITVVRQHVRPKSSSPVVVHCSAGVGRSGTFICLDYALQFITEQPITAELDLFGFILRMRQARILMVQTESQYILIHQCARFMMEQRRRRVAERISSNSASSRMWTLEGATGIEMTLTLDDWKNDEDEPADQDTEELDTSQLSQAGDQSIERRPVFKNHREKSYESWHLGGHNSPTLLHVQPTLNSDRLSSP